MLQRKKAVQAKSLEKVQATHEKAKKQAASHPLQPPHARPAPAHTRGQAHAALRAPPCRSAFRIWQVAKLREDLDAITESLARKEASASEGQKDLQMGKQQRAEYNRLKADVGSKTAALAEQLQTKQREIKSEDAAGVQLKAKVDDLEREQADALGRVAAAEAKQEAGAAQVKELADKVKELKRKRAELAKGRESAKGRQGQLTDELARMQEQLSASKASQRETERERRSQEALENLMRLFPGVHGRMCGGAVCSPTHSKYDTAVTVAMGKNMDAIVVDEERVAHECVKYLKEKKCAPETFVPLDTIHRVKVPPERYRTLGGTKKPVLDVISVSDKFVKAVQYAVGDTLVCANLDEARKLAYHSKGTERFKVVTLDGSIINKGGLMTGGSSPGDRARANRWNQRDQKAYEELKQRAETTARELAKVDSVHAMEEHEQGARHEFDSAQQQLEVANDAQKATTAKLASYRKGYEAAGAALKVAAKELAAFTKKKGELEEATHKRARRPNRRPPLSPAARAPAAGAPPRPATDGPLVRARAAQAAEAGRRGGGQGVRRLLEAVQDRLGARLRGQAAARGEGARGRGARAQGAPGQAALAARPRDAQGHRRGGGEAARHHRRGGGQAAGEQPS